MQLKATVQPAGGKRYQLTLLKYPSPNCISDVCELVYDSRDKNLLRSLSDLPYVIGRSFPPAEVQRITKELQELQVTHKFKNLADETDVVGWDPESTKAEFISTSNQAEKSKTANKNLLSYIKRPSFVSGLILVTGIVIALIFFDMPWSSKPEKTSKIATSAINDSRQATIEDFSRDVEYRRRSEFLWQKVARDLGLSEDDGLRTYENSTALLRYQEGSRVFVRPNTLMIIGKNLNPVNRQIRLEDGTLQARLKPTATESKLLIETKMGTLEVTSPKPGEKAKEARIETHYDAAQFKISVTEGQAVLKPPQPNAPSIEVKSQQEIVATPTSVSAPTLYEPRLTLFAPATESSVEVNAQQNAPIIFEWEDLGADATYAIEITSDAALKNSLFHQELKANKLELQYLDPGPVYWQVTGQFEGIAYKSAIQKLNVQEHHN